MLSTLTNFVFYHTPIFYLIQSVWRDEAFSYFMSKPDIISIIRNTANDFNPPLYYLLLHFWMQIAGRDDIALRLLSFMPHLGLTYIAYLLGQQSPKKIGIFMALFVLLNPILLYYAFEMRMYSWFAFFTLSSLYFLISGNFKWYIITAIGGLYSHSFFPLIIVSWGLACYINLRKVKKEILLILAPLLFFIPWLPVLINQFLRSKDSWIYPVDLQLVFSSLGNLFTGYEGTPGNLWQYTAGLSFLIVFFIILLLKSKNKLKYYIVFPICLPLLLILGYSLLARPLYVNRYLIFVSVFEIIAISYAIDSLKFKILRTTAKVSWLVFVILINLYAAGYRKKTDFKMTISEINSLAKRGDFVYAETPIGFLETAYYFKDAKNVFIYNPNHVSIPSYIGVTVVFNDISRDSFPPPPSRTFVVADDASYKVVINQ